MRLIQFRKQEALKNMGENHGVSSPASVADKRQVFMTSSPCQGARQPSHLAFVISPVCQGTQSGILILEAWTHGLAGGRTTAKRLGMGSSYYGGTGQYRELNGDDLYYWWLLAILVWSCDYRMGPPPSTECPTLIGCT